MAKAKGARCRIAAAMAAAAIGLLAGCSSRTGPAPLVNGGLPPEPPSITVTVEPGQTLSRIALDHHVPMQAIAEANHLSPPYRIIAGATLVVPGVVPGVVLGGGPAGDMGAPAVLPAPAAVAAAPPSAPVAVAALPPPQPEPLSSRPEAAPVRHPAALASRSPEAGQPIPLDRPLPPIAKPERAAPPANPDSLSPPPASSQAEAETPVHGKPAAAGPANAPPSHEKSIAAASPTPAPPPPAPPPAPHGNAAFLWPVRGHVLEGFGAGPGGTHNDGINIAAPRGAAVEAADGGVVAYAGNELRGYGNLILVKHPNGWITAYAHCDMMLVKPGQKVAKGQVIARVGSTGNVGEPQLHFELRRGNKPVDPREYLAPLPTAEAKDPRSG